MADSVGQGGGGGLPLRESPPKAVIDTSPLVIDRNKESLKVKLMLRRPHDQLVAQGIMPPHKTPAYHGQRRQLERARTGDMLKTKIQQRPPRQELERRHILVDAGATVHVDPSLAERQRMLEKARLADQLNAQLSHRPGPLELIEKNILHTEEPIEQAVKAGQISYKATSEGQLNRPQHPHRYTTPEEDSQSSEDNTVPPSPCDVLETAAKSAGIVVSLIPSDEGTVVVTSAGPILAATTSTAKEEPQLVFTPLLQPQASSPVSSASSTLSPLSAAPSPASSAALSPSSVPPPPPPPPVRIVQQVVGRSDAPGKDKGNRKKAKAKASPKARTIKFHEYKGPPSAQKSTNNSLTSANSSESSYDLLLKQQTLLLQFQLQLQHKYPQIQHKYPQIILPASQKNSGDSSGGSLGGIPSPAPSTSSESSQVAPTRLTGRLEDMKVSDLKAELKRRSLPVSGPKPQLIERLKTYTFSSDTPIQNSSHLIDSTSNSSSLDQSHHSPPYKQDPASPISVKDEPVVTTTTIEHMDVSEPPSPMPPQSNQQHEPLSQLRQQEDLVREQRRQIEELQRELELSQLKLQAATNSSGSSSGGVKQSEPKQELLQHLQQKQRQEMALQMQQLQALQQAAAHQAQVIEEHQCLQQQQRNHQQQQQQQQQQQEQQQRQQQRQHDQQQQQQHHQQQQQQQQQQEQHQQQQQQHHIPFQNQKNGHELILNGANGTALFLQLMQQGKAKVLNGHSRAASLPNFFTPATIITTTAMPEIKADYYQQHETVKPQDQEYRDFIDKSTVADYSSSNSDLKPPPLYEEATKQMNKKNHIKSQIVDDVLEILIKNGELPPSAAQDPSTPGSAGTPGSRLSEPPLFPTNPSTTLMDVNTPESMLGIDPNDLLDTLDNIDNMDFTQLVMEIGNNVQQQQNSDNNNMVQPMDTDEWLDSLLPSDDDTGQGNGNYTIPCSESDMSGYDPVLGVTQEPFDPFGMDEFKSPGDLGTLSWDKVDFSV